jgi:hypothetical protein
MPSPAAGKGDTPRTPTKLGRKPQQAAPKLNKPTEDAPTSDVSEKAQDAKQQGEGLLGDAQEKGEDVKGKAEDTAKDAKDKTEETTEDTTGKVSQAGDELEQAEPKPIDEDAEEAEDETQTTTLKMMPPTLPAKLPRVARRLVKVH